MSGSDSCCSLEVLVVDDDKVVSLLHKNQLKFLKLCSPPVLCNNGKEALDHLLKNDFPGKNYLIFLDLNMPVLDGWNFLKKLKALDLKSQLFVVVITSSINERDYLKAQRFEQVIHFCRKPMNKGCVAKLTELSQLKQFFPPSEGLLLQQ